MSDYIIVDATGKLCPVPLLMTHVVLKTMKSGEKLKLITTTEDSIPDIETFCKYTPHTLINYIIDNNRYVFNILKN